MRFIWNPKNDATQCAYGFKRGMASKGEEVEVDEGLAAQLRGIYGDDCLLDPKAEAKADEKADEKPEAKTASKAKSGASK